MKQNMQENRSKEPRRVIADHQFISESWNQHQVEQVAVWDEEYRMHN